MSYVERVNSLAGAREVLGISPQAGEKDIRAAWKRVAFDTHPDRNGGSRTAFDRAKAAYALLLGEEPGVRPRRPTGPANASRPRVMARSEHLSPECVAACAQVLSEPERFPGAAPRHGTAHFGLDGTVVAGQPTTDHIPATTEREGRNVVFVFQTGLSQGINRVAVPSSEFCDRRKFAPRIVVFRSPTAGSGVVAIPPEVLQSMLPGARSAKLRFTGQ